MKRILTLLLAVLTACGARQAMPAKAEVPVRTTDKDREIAEAILQNLQSAPQPSRDRMLHAALSLLGTPYVASTLEKGDREELRVSLTETDCILFVETCFNLVEAVNLYGEEADFDKFADLVRQSRYRGGKVERYSDRIHYTTEWIRQGEARGLLKDMTLELGGISADRPINYMSRHKASYRQIAKAPHDTAAARDLAVITEVEKKLSETPQSWIRTETIPSIEEWISSGDIICFMSGVPGLDIAHVGIAYVQDGRVGFIHASSTGKKVMVDPRTIAEYTAARKNCPGIKVVKVLGPNDRRGGKALDNPAGNC